MKALKFLKVDWIRCKSQLKIMILFPVVAVVLAFRGMDNELFAITYMVFGAIVFAIQPFTMEQMSESGFINMLPGTKSDRVTGRYLFAFILILLSVLLGLGATVVYDMKHGISLEPALTVSCIFFGGAMVICSLQYILFYSLGKGKSNQMMAIIRIIPAFIMFFAGNYVLNWLKSGETAKLNWILDRTAELSALCVLVGFFVFFVGISISGRIIEHKDFA
ncbi:MAG TPA: ABC-2 transporter permease [Clostridiales bacterium]|nr:ABC-2 transporter permease [Clostridiales bacterium]